MWAFIKRMANSNDICAVEIGRALSPGSLMELAVLLTGVALRVTGGLLPGLQDIFEVLINKKAVKLYLMSVCN